MASRLPMRPIYLAEGQEVHNGYAAEHACRCVGRRAAFIRNTTPVLVSRRLQLLILPAAPFLGAAAHIEEIYPADCAVL